jgi:uncharacterized oligopeptide transporter (OPT) family protein
MATGRLIQGHNDLLQVMVQSTSTATLKRSLDVICLLNCVFDRLQRFPYAIIVTDCWVLQRRIGRTAMNGT